MKAGRRQASVRLMLPASKRRWPASARADAFAESACRLHCIFASVLRVHFLVTVSASKRVLFHCAKWWQTALGESRRGKSGQCSTAAPQSISQRSTSVLADQPIHDGSQKSISFEALLSFMLIPASWRPSQRHVLVPLTVTRWPLHSARHSHPHPSSQPLHVFRSNRAYFGPFTSQCDFSFFHSLIHQFSHLHYLHLFAFANFVFLYTSTYHHISVKGERLINISWLSFSELFLGEVWSVFCKTPETVKGSICLRKGTLFANATL